VILKVVNLFVPLRVSAEDENQGLDISQHDERGYNL
jgi:Amt family ammonium transporter